MAELKTLLFTLIEIMSGNIICTYQQKFTFEYKIVNIRFYWKIMAFSFYSNTLLITSCVICNVCFRFFLKVVMSLYLTLFPIYMF